MMILMGLLSLLTPRQELFLLKTMVPEITDILILAESPDSNETVAKYRKAASLYRVSVDTLKVKSTRKAPVRLTKHLMKGSPGVIVLTDEDLFRDVLFMTELSRLSAEKNIPVLGVDRDHVTKGASFAFESQDDGTIMIYYSSKTRDMELVFPEGETYQFSDIN